MAGHSKWSSIKHKKAAIDAKKGKAFTRVSNMISIAAREGGDTGMNSALALAIEKAKEVNMPKANIERAIKKGTGELGGQAIEEVIYEGYAPGGVGIIIETATDNKNRTVSEIRSTLIKFGGSMASAGAVMFNFEHIGQIEINPKDQALSQEKIEEIIIESGVKDIEIEEDSITVYTEPRDLILIKDKTEKQGVIASSGELSYIARNKIRISNVERARKILGLLNSLEALDDVINVYSNVDFSDEILGEFS